jgi:plastocyanin
MRLLPRLAAALACLAPALIAGCGDDGGSATTSRGPNTVVMTDYAYHPRDVRVRRGQTLTVVNEGGIAHNLTIERGPNPRDETERVAGTDSFLKGDRAHLRVNLTPGRYVMVCTVPGHRELGMVGTVAVR